MVRMHSNQMRVVKICNTRSEIIPCRVTSILINMNKLTYQSQATKKQRELK